MPTNTDIAREFCKDAFQRTFDLSDERTEAYIEVITALLDHAVENALKERK